MTIYKIKAGRVPDIALNAFIGTADTIFFDHVNGSFRISDGVTPGGQPLSINGVNITLANISDLHIPGGTNGQVLSTDGAGNLSWTTVSGGGGVQNQFLAAEGVPTLGDPATFGFSFQGDGNYDTGMFSATDGHINLYSNAREVAEFTDQDIYFKTGNSDYSDTNIWN